MLFLELQLGLDWVPAGFLCGERLAGVGSLLIFRSGLSRSRILRLLGIEGL